MKRLLLTHMLLGCVFSLAQSNEQNWIKTTEYLNPQATQKKVTVQYFDGLGRPNQVVSHKQSTEGKDIITHIGYDEFGRQAKEDLPYSPNRSSLIFDANAEAGTTTYYQTHYGTNIVYSEKEFEASPLNRVLKQAAPGDAWALGSGHEIKFDYQTNTQKEVRIFTAYADFQNNTIGLNQGSFYEAGQLYKTVTYDENHTGDVNNDTTNPSPETQNNTISLSDRIEGLEAGQTYQFKVKRICENGIASEWSDIFTISPYHPPNGCEAPNAQELLWRRITPEVEEFNAIDKDPLYTIYANLPGRTPKNLGMNDIRISYANENLVSSFMYDFMVRKKCSDDTISDWSPIYNIPLYDESSVTTCESPTISDIGFKRISETEVAFDYIDKSSQYFIEFIGDNTPTGLISQDITGEDHSIEEFKNKEGQVVLKRTYNNNIAHDTYYVYDIYGNLTYVIPPLVNLNTGITQNVLDDLCYQYKYDYKNRLIEKKLPGKGWEYMVYDKQDRLVGTQDALLKDNNQWLFTKYDKFGRVVYTGIVGDSAERPSVQQAVDGYGSNNVARETSGITQNGITIDYQEANAWPPSFSELHTVNYYDDYNFTQASTPAETVEGVLTITEVPSAPTHNVTTKGLATASFVRILGIETWEKTFTYYDSKSRPIRTHKENHLGGYTTIDTKLDFRGKPQYDITYHKKAQTSEEIKVKNNYFYDSNTERLVKQTQKINQQTEELVVKNTYDRLGQLESKLVGGQDTTASTYLQQIDYSYNIRGWLTAINNIDNLEQSTQPRDLFAFQMNYNDIEENTTSGVEPLYNGNIAQTLWKTDIDNQTRAYTYSYDALNRLRKSYYHKNNVYKGTLDEHLSYDKNGNITTLKRWGTPETQQKPVLPDIDHLNYTYYPNSNQLKAVNDFTNSDQGFKDGVELQEEYIYDANGNMTRDKNKGIENIAYNHLNLPTEVRFGSTKKIQYLYTTTGVKVQKTVTNGTNITTTDYIDGFQYEGEDLKFFPHAEGYVNNGDNGFEYVYNYTDHLGNVRLSYKDNNGSVEVVEENNYYPFGLKHNYNLTPSGNQDNAYKYKYQGQERQDELGLNWDSFKWRNYDYAIGRFMSIDPLAEDYSYQSPYNFSENRVVDGRELEGLEYVSVHHYANGAVSKTEYYKMSNSQIEKLGGTPAGIHNSVPYGSEGRGIVHYYYNDAGNRINNRTIWEMQQTGGESDFMYHGLYSGPGSITYDGTNYNFDAQPIDLADAIAKRHDMDYASIAGEDYANFLEDIRTLQADLDMIQRIDDYTNPFKSVKGVETPVRKSFSTEMDGSALGQRIVIQALATYKQWKIDNKLGNNDVYNDNRDAFAKDNPATAEIIDLIKPE